MQTSEKLKAAALGLGLAAVAAAGFLLSMAPALADKYRETGDGGFEHQDAADLAAAGAVAALGTDLKGTPFVSLTPYALDAEGRPFVYVSALAAHTKNLKATAASSLMVSKVDDDNVFNSARLTFVGTTARVTDAAEVAALKKIYHAKYPAADGLDAFHDFGFYRMAVGRLHYVGGFGDIRWIDGKDWAKGFKGAGS